MAELWINMEGSPERFPKGFPQDFSKAFVARRSAPEPRRAAAPRYVMMYVVMKAHDERYDDDTMHVMMNEWLHYPNKC